MKKLILILSICLGVNTVVWSKSEPDRKEVVLEKVDNDSKESRPRTLVGVPITCLTVNTSSESGNYLIEIVTEDGTYYYGEYTLL